MKNKKGTKEIFNIVVDSDRHGDWLKTKEGKVIKDARVSYCKECGQVIEKPDYFPLICELLNRLYEAEKQLTNK